MVGIDRRWLKEQSASSCPGFCSMTDSNPTNALTASRGVRKKSAPSVAAAVRHELLDSLVVDQEYLAGSPRAKTARILCSKTKISSGERFWSRITGPEKSLSPALANALSPSRVASAS